jgi:hypothetical protein
MRGTRPMSGVGEPDGQADGPGAAADRRGHARRAREIAAIMAKYQQRVGSIEEVTPCVEAERLKAGLPALLRGSDLPESVWPRPRGIGSDTEIVLYPDGRFEVAAPCVMFDTLAEVHEYRRQHPGYLLHSVGARRVR